MQVETHQKNTVDNPIHVIGTEASGPEKLPYHLQELIFSAENIAAPKRLIESISEWWVNSNVKSQFPEIFESDNPLELVLWLKGQSNQTIVIASGDPLWFGIGRHLIESLPSSRLIFHPSTSSLQLAFARLGRSWQDASWISLHGRDSAPLANSLQQRPKSLAILTDPSRGGVEEIRQYLRASGLERSYELWICERLGHPLERIQRIRPRDELANDLHPLNLVVLLSEQPSAPEPKDLPLFGIEDGIYLQHEDRPGLMTKREIRIQLIADLELPEEGVLWDIGAGVGSVGLEALRIRPSLQLLAIERRTGASALIQANAKRLFVKPPKIIESEALRALSDANIPKGLANPDRVILGGGGLDRKKILEIIINRLTPGGVVVIPLVTLEAVSELTAILKASKCQLSISQHQPWRGVPLAHGTRLAPVNPVFILKGKVF